MSEKRKRRKYSTEEKAAILRRQPCILVNLMDFMCYAELSHGLK